MDFHDYSSLFSQLSIDFSWLDTWLVLTIVIIVIAFTVIAIIWGIRAHKKPISSGREEFIGKIAVVDTTLSPKGLVLVEGERWRAILDKGQADPEEEVIITRVEGLKLFVTRKIHE